MLVGCCSASHAQIALPGQASFDKAFSVRAGAIFPSNGADKSIAGSTQLSLGADYAFSKLTPTMPSVSSVYLDYFGGSKNGGHDTNFGLGVSERSNSSSTKRFAPYTGAGIGIYDQSVNNFYSKQYTTIGGKLFAGLQLEQGVFLEASYNLVASHQGVNPSSFGVQAGLRF